jgi:hypothetical protein
MCDATLLEVTLENVAAATMCVPSARSGTAAHSTQLRREGSVQAVFELKQESPQDVTHPRRVPCTFVDLPSQQGLHSGHWHFPVCGQGRATKCCTPCTLLQPMPQQQSKRRGHRVSLCASDAEDGPSRVNDDSAGDAILPLEAAAAAAGDGVGGGSSDEQEGQKHHLLER